MHVESDLATTFPRRQTEKKWRGKNNDRSAQIMKIIDVNAKKNKSKIYESERCRVEIVTINFRIYNLDYFFDDFLYP